MKLTAVVQDNHFLGLSKLILQVDVSSAFDERYIELLRIALRKQFRVAVDSIFDKHSIVKITEED